ncbi:MAG: RNA polymerase sigma factor, partial [Desulfobacterales bacterium]|nr:RNA polymerase sigma factor [Desulfobacterales bacterium]
MKEPLIDYVMHAREGDKEALEEVVRGMQERVFGLSLRMLRRPSDAEDASQEILIKIVTHLGAFRGDGSFRAWAMKIAVNHLLSVLRKQKEPTISFEEMASRIVGDWDKPWRELESHPMQNLIVEEFRIACLQVVLLGLDHPHRLAYILGEVFEVSGREGGETLGIRESAFRKRLQRARSRIRAFLQTNCALIRPGNPCICERQADHFVST